MVRLTDWRLIGFGIWERRGPAPGRNVAFPARRCSVSGERRSFALLRPIADAAAQDRVRGLLPQACTASSNGRRPKSKRRSRASSRTPGRRPGAASGPSVRRLTCHLQREPSDDSEDLADRRRRRHISGVCRDICVRASVANCVTRASAAAVPSGYGPNGSTPG
ncbi:MAG: hypothetical protein MZV70_07700 [Desulfobacterales bacterium]|nr:hypothetical protein [Desulfobacterales bacterium]